MSLDKNLFTLIFTPHKDNANVIDLVDPSGTTHYRKQRTPAPNGEYRIEVYDPMSESLLATAAGTNASAKVKTIELCNPTSVVELKYTGTLSFKWGFKWEGHDFEWKREECFMIRKPDPPVIIAVTKEPKGRLQTTTVQILDYNLNRFDIDDRKGLEIVVLTALLTFQDANEAYHTPDTPTATGSANPLSRASSAKAGPVVLAPPATMADSSSSGYGAGGPPPLPPPKPAPKTGVDRIAELQAIKGEYNEIVISDEGSIQDYASYCNNLLQDDAMLFITVKSAEMEQVPKVLQVVEETKRIRYKAGLDEEELHQYVLYDVQEARKGPRIINLDDEKKNKYAPPKNLTVHLSKISMPELQPKAGGSHRDSKIGSSSSKDKKAAAAAAASSSKVPSRPAPELPPPSNTKNNSNKPSKHKPTKEPKPKTPSPPPMHGQKPGKGGNKLQRPSGPGQSGQKVHAHQVHPHQPSPSPSQLNNPGIYAAPPPQKHSRPTSAYEPRPSSSGGGGVSFPMPWGGSGGGGGGGGGNNGSGSGSGMTPAQLYASSFGRRYDSPSSGAQGHAHSSSYPTSWNPSSGPPPPPPPPPPAPPQQQQQQPTIHQPQPQQAHASMGQFGVKPITTANVVQGVSSVAHGLMGMINNARHK